MKTPLLDRTFLRLCKTQGVPVPQREVRFAHPRKWRFDYGAKNVLCCDMAKCRTCQTRFQPTRPTQVYCSAACRYAQRLTVLRSGLGKGWSLGKEYVPRRSCVICHGLFYAPPVLMRRGGGTFCSRGCKGVSMSRNPEAWPKGRRGVGGRRTDLQDRYFRSRWEANWARYLNLLIARGNISKWEYEPKVFEFVGIKRGSRTYTPDFRITRPDGSTEWHEVKGYMDQRSATKIARMGRYYPTEKLVVIGKKEYHAVQRVLAGAIAGWETTK